MQWQINGGDMCGLKDKFFYDYGFGPKGFGIYLFCKKCLEIVFFLPELKKKKKRLKA